jgi:uncharacterized repeat protein (TIGR03803 family)
MTPLGKLTTLYDFCSQNSPEANCTDGYGPVAGVIQASNGNLYGTTYWGGAFNPANGESNAGTVYEIPPTVGSLTWVYSFCSATSPASACTDGFAPYGGLVQGTDGNLYGTTAGGGEGKGGTIFQITPAGSLTTEYSFCLSCSSDNSNSPLWGALVQDTNGTFYGTAGAGGNGNSTCNATFGSLGCGTVFRLSMNLGPFVEPQTTSGAVGATVKILGTSLTNASSVSFNGTAAAFAVVSSSEITATVPAGASYGFIQVVTAHGGTLSSNVPFTVLQ